MPDKRKAIDITNSVEAISVIEKRIQQFPAPCATGMKRSVVIYLDGDTKVIMMTFRSVARQQDGAIVWGSC